MNLVCSRGMPVTRRGLTKTLSPGTVVSAMGMWYKKALGCQTVLGAELCPDVCLSLACLGLSRVLL